MKKISLILATLCTFGAGSTWAEKPIMRDPNFAKDLSGFQITKEDKERQKKSKECRENKWQGEECQAIKNKNIKEGEKICKEDPGHMMCDITEKLKKE